MLGTALLPQGGCQRRAVLQEPADGRDRIFGDGLDQHLPAPRVADEHEIPRTQSDDLPELGGDNHLALGGGFDDRHGDAALV